MVRIFLPWHDRSTKQKNRLNLVFVFGYPLQFNPNAGFKIRQDNGKKHTLCCWRSAVTNFFNRQHLFRVMNAWWQIEETPALQTHTKLRTPTELFISKLNYFLKGSSCKFKHLSSLLEVLRVFYFTFSLSFIRGFLASNNRTVCKALY